MSCSSGYINILDDFLLPDGSPWTGSITYTLIFATTVAGATIINARQVVNIDDGVDLCLAPGIYDVVYNQSGQDYPVSGQWTVPSTGGPYTVSDVGSGTSTIGATGPQGPTGATGATGPQGVPGNPVGPMITYEDPNTLTHVTFTDQGLLDAEGLPWAFSSATADPAVSNIPPSANAMTTSRTTVGAFTDSNYFTQGTAGAGLANINGAFTVCLAFYITSDSNGPVLVSNWSGTSGQAGYYITLTPGGGAYLLCNGFAGPQALNKTVSGLNIICCGVTGVGAGQTGFIKVNNGPVVQAAVQYNPTVTGVFTVGRYGPSTGKSFNGTFDELWFSSDTPSESELNRLFAVAQGYVGSGYRWPDTSGTKLHMIGRDYSGGTWTAPQATLTTNGTVSSSASTNYVTRVIPGRWGVYPGGTAVVSASASLTNASFYQLPAASNVFNAAGDFSCVVIARPEAGDISGTAIYCSTGVSQGTPGWQLVNESGATTFYGTTGSVQAVSATSDKLNVLCFGKAGANLVLKMNDGIFKSAPGTITQSSTEGRIGMHWDYLIGFNGTIYELWFSSSTPTDTVFSEIVANVLANSIWES